MKMADFYKNLVSTVMNLENKLFFLLLMSIHAKSFSIIQWKMLKIFDEQFYIIMKLSWNNSEKKIRTVRNTRWFKYDRD